MKSNTTLATTALMMAIAMTVIAYGPVGAQDLKREFIDPAGVFTQVVTVADHGVKTIYVSGQAGNADSTCAARSAPLPTCPATSFVLTP